jgi:transcriptional regulator with XRE-family HTH domain
MDETDFGPRLKELREQAGLTQPQLAERSGLTKAGIANLEQGRREPGWSSVLALCRALGVTPDAFTQPPSERPDAKRGRPRKTPTETAPTPKNANPNPARKRRTK